MMTTTIRTAFAVALMVVAQAPEGLADPLVLQMTGDGGTTWKFVCGDRFSQESAPNSHGPNVACRELGSGSYSQGTYGTSASLNKIGKSIPADHDKGSKTANFYDSVDCDGSESRLNDCPRENNGNEDCALSEAVTLSCKQPPRSVKLHTGKQSGGLLQMTLDGGQTWKFVCDDSFQGVSEAEKMTTHSKEGANIACRELGFMYSIVHTGHWWPGGYDPPAGTFYDDVNCIGTERFLKDCPRSDTDNCGHGEMVYLECTDTPPPPSVRLVNGYGQETYDGYGTLQMRVAGTGWDRDDGSWKYVCDDSFEFGKNPFITTTNGFNPGPNIACRELGFMYGTATLAGHLPNIGTWPNGADTYDDIFCTGSERFLADCKRRDYGHNCGSQEGAILTCTNEPKSVRLDGYGLLQMRGDGGQWRHVCKNVFNVGGSGPNVACGELGSKYGTYTPGTLPSHINVAHDTFYENVQCEGIKNLRERDAAMPGSKALGFKEPRLVDCSYTTAHTGSCGRGDAVALICSNEPSVRIYDATSKPTTSPTPGPTLSPTTTSPTTSPTTTSPTTSPTLGPTASPTLSPTPGPTQFPTSRPSVSPTPSPTYNTAAIDEARANFTAVLAKVNASSASAPIVAVKSDATAVKKELEAAFAAYKILVREHMKVLLADKQFTEYDAKKVLGRFQVDQTLFGDAKAQIRVLRKKVQA